MCILLLVAIAPISASTIANVVRAHQEALAEGDRALGKGSIQNRILHAMVTSSAAELAVWLGTRVPDGERLAKPLDELIARLRPGDAVGEGVRRVESWLGSQLLKTVVWAALGAKAPVLVVGLIAAAVGVAGLAIKAGIALGVAVASGAIPVLLIYAVLRGTLMSAPKEIELGAFYPDPVARAESIYDARIRPELSPVYASHGVVFKTPLVAKLRGTTYFWLTVVYLLVAGALVLGTIGFWAGFTGYTNQPRR